MILLNAHQIEKSYADKTLFSNVSFGIEDNERIGFVGPNGAGKSTLLRILAGQVEPDAGTVSRKKGLRVGFLEQTPQFQPQATIMTTLLEKSIDPEDARALAFKFMAQLELSFFGEDYLVSELSGGWKKRVALGRELVQEPELLFLDEPTNHLDVSSILWLEEYLKSAPFSLLMITHDRLFLQRVAQRILDLDPRNPNYLFSIKGEYSQYLEAKELELATSRRHEWVEKNRLRRETEWLSRGSIARQTKQSARIQAAGDLKETVQDLKSKNQNRKVDLEFGEAEHSPKKLVEAKGLGKSFASRILFRDLDLLITPKTRLGLLGDNGSGKSTLIKVILGLEPADEGSVRLADGIDISYFEQSRESLDFERSVLKNICPDGDYVFFQGQAVHVRSYLDRFFFSGHKAELPVKKLSGGEQARLRLAQMMLKQSQILVLDEPTNDLDMDTLESLEQTLGDFNGAVILVTHDRFFLDAVTNQILAFPPYEMAEGRLEKFSDYFQWEKWFKEAKSKSATAASAAHKKTSAASSTSNKVKLSYKEKYELENMEAGILLLEDELSKLNAESVDSSLVSNHQRMTEIHTRIAELQATIESKYERWAELDAKKGS